MRQVTGGAGGGGGDVDVDDGYLDIVDSDVYTLVLRGAVVGEEGVGGEW